jgi:hypothetical protein
MPENPSDLLQELSKERKKKFSDTVLQEKLTGERQFKFYRLSF